MLKQPGALDALEAAEDAQATALKRCKVPGKTEAQMTRMMNRKMNLTGE